MMLTLEARTPCTLCGCWLRCLAFPSARVNKRSVRQLPGIFLRTDPGRCPECGFEPWLHAPPPGGSYLATPWCLTAESAAEVEAYRARRWPERKAS